MKSLNRISSLVLAWALLGTAPQALAWWPWGDSSESSKPAPAKDPRERLRQLNGEVQNQDVSERYGRRPTASASQTDSAAVTDLAQTLPDIDNYKVPVLPMQADVNQSTVEIFSSTEKSTERPADSSINAGSWNDNWLNEMAREFNELPGTPGKVAIRSIDSGVTYQYLVRQKLDPYGSYAVEAVAPSNALWIRMAEAKGIAMTEVSPSLVGNVAGIVIRKAKLQELGYATQKMSVIDLMVAVQNGQLKMGYTNPFSSSTGLNFMTTVLNSLAQGLHAEVDSPEVIEAFRKFQSGVPITFETTLQLRDAIKSGERLDAMVMEYQTFVNSQDLKADCEFIPFGERHDNPLYAVADLAPEKMNVLKAFSDFVKNKQEAKEKATRMGFNALSDYNNPQQIDGSSLIHMQQLWKAEKAAGSKVAAIFLGDVSGSMSSRGRMGMVQKALQVGANFVRPENNVGLIVFDDQVTRVLPIRPFDESQKSDFIAYTEMFQPDGGTAMYDGIVSALTDLIDEANKTESMRPVLIVLSDGESGNDQTTVREVRELISKVKIPVYILGLDPSADLFAEMKEVARSSGGDAFSVTPETVENRIASLLNSQL